MALAPDLIRRGTVVFVRLPKDKARPAVVVRSDRLAELSYATILPIMSDRRAGSSMRIDIEPTSENGLREPSQIMVDWPQSIRFSDMGEAIGRLDLQTMLAVTRQMAVVLGIGGGTGRTRRRTVTNP